MKLKCPCCGTEREFGSSEEAFDAGWDAPPDFSYVACDLCPAACVLLGETHAKAHAYWAEHGRPNDFNPIVCCPDSEWERYDGEHRTKYEEWRKVPADRRNGTI